MKRLLSLIFVIVAVVILAPACGSRSYQYTRTQTYAREPVKVISIWIDNSFGEADQIAFSDVVSAWNYSLNGYIKLVIVDDHYVIPEKTLVAETNQNYNNSWLIMKINADHPPIPIPKSTSIVMAYGNKIGGNVVYVIRRRVANSEMFGLILHELSHLLGCHHVKNDDSLMYKYYGDERNECIDFDTIVQVAAYNHLDVNKLNYCIKGR